MNPLEGIPYPKDIRNSMRELTATMIAFEYYNNNVTHMKRF